MQHVLRPYDAVCEEDNVMQRVREPCDAVCEGIMLLGCLTDS